MAAGPAGQGEQVMSTKHLVPILALLAGASTTTSAANPTGSVEGSLVEQPDNKPVSGSVNVTCGTVRKSGRADASGHFLIEGLPEGACTLTAAGGDFVTVAIGVNVTAGSISPLLVSVTSRAYAEKLRRDQERYQREELKRQKEMSRYRSKAMK